MRKSDPSELDTEALAHMLRTSRWPLLREQQPTFFSIAAIGHKELPLSNVYAFFFRSDAPHGLGTLFLRALLSIVKAKAPVLVAEWPEVDGPVRVAREYGIDKRQRLDLLVHDGPADTGLQGASFAVLIENKVHHWLANELTNYMSSVRGPLRKLGIVLGVQPEKPVAPWIFVSHAELARAVEMQLGPQLTQVNARYLPVLLHLLEHLTHMGDQHMNFSLAFDFAQQHRVQLAKASQLLGHLTGQALGTAVAEALGEGYVQGPCFEDRVDIWPEHSASIYYVVYFGNILNLAKDPGFAITLYAPDATKEQVVKWQTYLQAQPAAVAAGLAPLPWFGRNNPSLLVGRSYFFTGTKLTELQAQIKEVIMKHWKPLEEAWMGHAWPPAALSQSVEGKL